MLVLWLINSHSHSNLCHGELNSLVRVASNWSLFQIKDRQGKLYRLNDERVLFSLSPILPL